MKDFIEVNPHGLVGGMMPDLCLMVFKEKKGAKRFALPLSYLQGQISLHQNMNQEDPFRFIGEILNTMKLNLEKCYFFKDSRGVIFAKLVFTSPEGEKSFNVKAGEALSFAVHSGAKFFCTKSFIEDMMDQKMEQPLKKHELRRPLYLN